jgi:hypothetical protein
MDIQTNKFYSFHRPATSLVALYCLSSDSQHNPRLRIGAGHSILTSRHFSNYANKSELAVESAPNRILMPWTLFFLGNENSLIGTAEGSGVLPFPGKFVADQGKGRIHAHFLCSHRFVRICRFLSR